MIKKLLLVLLVVIFVGCQKQITIAEKEVVVKQFSEIVQQGELIKLNEISNTNLNFEIPISDDNMKTVVDEILKSIRITTLKTEGNELEVLLESYPMEEMLKKATTVINVFRGSAIDKKPLTEEQIKQKYRDNVNKLLKEVQRKQYRIKPTFVLENKKVQLNFQDAETKRLLEAILGR